MARDSFAQNAPLREPGIGYPTREKLRTTLADMEKALRTAFLAHAQRVSAAGGNHDTTRNLIPQVDGLFQTLTRYAKMERVLGVPEQGTPVVIVSPSQVGTLLAFRELAAGSLASVFTDIVEKAETSLLAEADVTFNPLSAMDLQEYSAWRHIVRITISATVLGALDYKAVWGQVDGDVGWELVLRVANFLGRKPPPKKKWPGVDGDAGWELAGRVTKFADAFAAENAIEEIIEEPYVSELLRSVLLAAPVTTAIDGPRDISSEARRWQSGPPQGATTSDLGNRYPYLFDVIPSELTFKSDETNTPPEMHARPQVIDRARLLFKYWAYVIKELKLDPKEHPCGVIAGSLAHGGHHPPHQAHQDGSELDVNIHPVRELKFGVEGPPRLTLHADSTQDENLMLEPSGEEEVAASDTKIDDAGSVPASAEEPRPAPPQTPDWKFPIDKRSDQWYLLARKFTHCIYLTCPGSIIFASQHITEQAKEEILERFDAILDEVEADDDPSQKKRAARMRVARTVLADIKIAVWTGMSVDDEIKIRTVHRNHWHVNYYADLLGDAGPWRSRKPDSAARVKAALEALDEGDLWMELLKEPDSPFDNLP